MKKFLIFKAAAISTVALMFSLTACTGTTSENGEYELRGGDDTEHITRGEGDDWDLPPQDPNHDPSFDHIMGVRPPSELGNLFGHGEIIATINGTDIGFYDVSHRINDILRMFSFAERVENVDPEDFDSELLKEAVRFTALSLFVTEYAEEHGIYVPMDTRQDIADFIHGGVVHFGNEEGLNEMLQEDWIPDVLHYERVINVFSLMDTVVDTIIDTPALFAPFEQYLQEEDTELLGAMHILVAFETFEPGADPETVEASRAATLATAQALRARAVAGESFFDLKMEYSDDDPGKYDFPDGYIFRANQMVAEFEQGTRDLEIGEISEPIRTWFGYHIILRIEANPEDYVPDPWNPPPTLEQRMAYAIVTAFEEKVENASIVYLPALYTISLD